ncbi:methyltransferase [Parafrankia colletiae]|uniref:Methyltransferase n=1 Tax=Parafrankia colletiae TaxID=573497 RepID=A0A1S1R5R0_9ACTN|nr:class I SAM-dependent methyltransferase [Parafrankia colletiae]MCK9900778.1 class I SAM-dependent methyltransferase [Frankia sp. Cpl3]OHV42283.1 methyltransferase [Parafrankia colletiae]
MAQQYHFDPATYRDMVIAEVPAYADLQDQVARAGADTPTTRLLDLGAGTGETSLRVLARHPHATLVALDESAAMLDRAQAQLPTAHLHVGRLQDPLPAGPFDLVVSALAVHHLDGPGKADLFTRVAAVLRPGGRFVLGDVVVPDDPRDAVTPTNAEHDRPSGVREQIGWLHAAGFRAAVVWQSRDLVVIAADLTGT